MSQPSPVYSNVSIALHWIIALLVISQIGLIMAHDATEGDLSRNFVMLHKAGGMLILVLTVFRILWRFKEPVIALPQDTPTWQKLATHAVRIGFYVVLIGLPLVLGLTGGQTMRRIILPQTMRLILPVLGNSAVGMLKFSSLAATIAMTEMLNAAQRIYFINGAVIELLFVCAIWYLAGTSVLSVGQYYLERHFGRSDGGRP